MAARERFRTLDSALLKEIAKPTARFIAACPAWNTEVVMKLKDNEFVSILLNDDNLVANAENDICCAGVLNAAKSLELAMLAVRD
ncbi:MAG TPA: hypothetical protein VJ044_04530 [Candidatus Hodarchaeales archaeon]|nr:hypothetical protein [Candidatus Hodarchaeales archaeon]